MKKSSVVLIALLTLGAVAGTSVAVTYAANYVSEPETYTIDGSSDHASTFSIGHYFHGGDGTSTYPYLITNPIEMRNFAKLQNYGFITAKYYYKLNNSFNWSGDPMDPIGISGKAFIGDFDGGGKTISGLSVTVSGTSAGMFGVVSGAAIHDLVLAGPAITCASSSTKAGFICGTSTSASTITNVAIFGGSQNFEHRAKIATGASGTATTIAPYLVGTSANFTVTTSGFVVAVDSLTTKYTSRGDEGAASISIGTSSEKKFYANTSGIAVV